MACSNYNLYVSSAANMVDVAAVLRLNANKIEYTGIIGRFEFNETIGGISAFVQHPPFAPVNLQVSNWVEPKWNFVVELVSGYTWNGVKLAMTFCLSHQLQEKFPGIYLCVNDRNDFIFYSQAGSHLLVSREMRPALLNMFLDSSDYEFFDVKVR